MDWEHLPVSTQRPIPIMPNAANSLPVERERQQEDGGGLPGIQQRQTLAGPRDGILLYTALTLVAIGIASVFTASAVQADLETGNTLSVVIKQIISAFLGLAVLFSTARIPFMRWRNLAQVSGVVAIGLLLLTMLVGNTANGSERWIVLPFGFTFQPSDVAKVAAIFLMAQATSQKRLLNTNMFFNMGMVGLMIALILKQPNLSVSIILVLISMSMLLLAGSSILLMGFLGMGGVAGAWQVIKHNPYQMERISGWLNPWKDAQDTGYNLIQSYYAIGSGGLWGVGLGNSVQKLYYLPFQHTDFIFAVICEEVGFVGAAIVLGLFGVLSWRGFTIAWQCPNRFGQMLAFGLTMAIALQAMINVCVTVGLMPVTGVTLPLISYGGTSMIITLGMLGILLNISRYRSSRL
jgi:cell division protein FtsW